MPENPENSEQSDKPARPVYAKVEIQAGAQLPIYWTPEMAGIAREHDFNLTLQWLGSLMVAYNHLKHRNRLAVARALKRLLSSGRPLVG